MLVPRRNNKVYQFKHEGFKACTTNTVLDVGSHLTMTTKSVQQGMRLLHKCLQLGHFKRICRSVKVQKVYEDQNAKDSSDDNTETFIGVVDSQQESPCGQ